MKRKGYIIEEIISQENLEQSFDTVVRGTLRKSMHEGRWLIKNREKFLNSVREEILTGKISLFPCHRKANEIELANNGCQPKDIFEGGKHRRIQVYCMAARIKVNAVMSVVDKHLHSRYIRTTSASIKNRGVHELKEYIVRDMKMHPEIRYWYKFDIKKFYDTVKQDFAMYALEHVFKDKRLLAIMEQFIRLFPDDVGMSMGLRASQGVCNLLLSVYLDHYLKDRYGVKHYYRYCDDGLIGSETKLYLWFCRDIVHEQIEFIGQKIKQNERVFPIEEGLDFLGYKIYPTHALLRKRVKKSLARKLNRIKSRKRRQEIIGSMWGMAKHCNSWNLMEHILYPSEINKLRKKRKKNMKDFSSLNITYTPKDGKKRFANGAIQLRTLVNVKIEVLDFERDVTTKYGKRWLVQFRDTRDGTLKKFFTDCDEMKNNLDKLEEMGEIPFSTVIAAEYFGDNKVKYKFT